MRRLVPQGMIDSSGEDVKCSISQDDNGHERQHFSI